MFTLLSAAEYARSLSLPGAEIYRLGRVWKSGN